MVCLMADRKRSRIKVKTGVGVFVLEKAGEERVGLPSPPISPYVG